jgi:predicted Zn-dependent protease
MTTPRLDTFRAMVARSPANPLARFGLANELLKAELWQEAAEQLRVYLGAYDDEGNGYGRLAQACEALGLQEEARDALRRGIAAAERFGHTGMASELAGRLDDLEDSA